MILSEERCQHFIASRGTRGEYCAPDCPKVDGLAVALVIKHLWRHITEASGKGHKLLFRRMQVLGTA